MANTDGGFVVFGVTDKGATPNDRIVGIPLNNEEGHHFGQVIDKVRPDIRFVPKTIQIEDGHGIFVVHIPQSQRRPHMNEHDCKFYQRGDGGRAKAMEYQQVRDQMLLIEERRQRIALLIAKIGQFEAIAAEVEIQKGQEHECLDRFDIAFYDLLVSDVWGVLPVGSFIERLMRISQTANRINNAIALGGTPIGGGIIQGLTSAQTARVGTDLNLLKRDCKDCKRRLTTLLEPPPTDRGSRLS